ncbi:DUF6192 family protein [Streptomyces sp. NPDC056353]|uniref:DUF6192 family protein n=1 Tax=Streptomyces sp. NPDC056353 TaxID=3345792 RepID=UPI0035DADF70
MSLPRLSSGWRRDDLWTPFQRVPAPNRCQPGSREIEPIGQPKEHGSRKTASYRVRRAVANIGDETKRCTAIGTPPDGKARWTSDRASRRTGRQVEPSITPLEKVTAKHSPPRDAKGQQPSPPTSSSVRRSRTRCRRRAASG